MWGFAGALGRVSLRGGLAVRTLELAPALYNGVAARPRRPFE